MVNLFPEQTLLRRETLLIKLIQGMEARTISHGDAKGNRKGKRNMFSLLLM